MKEKEEEEEEDEKQQLYRAQILHNNNQFFCINNYLSNIHSISCQEPWLSDYSSTRSYDQKRDYNWLPRKHLTTDKGVSYICNDSSYLCNFQ